MPKNIVGMPDVAVTLWKGNRMTILANLAKHVTWRFARRAPTPTAAGAPDAPVRAVAGCVRCGAPRDDRRFKHCHRCRTRASLNQTKRRKMLVRHGKCPKCGGARGVETVVCSPCLAKGRARYHERKGG